MRGCTCKPVSRTCRVADHVSLDSTLFTAHLKLQARVLFHCDRLQPRGRSPPEPPLRTTQAHSLPRRAALPPPPPPRALPRTTTKTTTTRPRGSARTAPTSSVTTATRSSAGTSGRTLSRPRRASRSGSAVGCPSRRPPRAGCRWRSSPRSRSCTTAGSSWEGAGGCSAGATHWRGTCGGLRISAMGTSTGSGCGVTRRERGERTKAGFQISWTLVKMKR